MSKKLNRAVENLSIASLQLASAIENLSAIAREESNRAQHCSHPLSDMKAVAMSLSDFVQHCKDAEQSGCIAEEPNKAYGQTGDTYVGQTSDTCVGQTESSTQPPAQRITIPPVDLMAVSKGEVAKSQAISVETLSEATAQTEIPEVAEHAMYFQHNGSDSIFMVKKGDSLAFLANDDVSEISKSQYHRLKKQQEADEAAAKLAADEATGEATGEEADAAEEATGEADAAEEATGEADAAEEATGEADAAEEATNASDEAKNNAMFKLITKTLTQACNDTLISRVDIKKKLAKYDGATSISALTYDQKIDLWESWAKEFAEDDTLPF